MSGMGHLVVVDFDLQPGKGGGGSGVRMREQREGGGEEVSIVCIVCTGENGGKEKIMGNTERF